VSRHRIAYLVSVPLMLGGTELGHWLSFRLVYPGSAARAAALQASGHGELSLLPALAVAALALLLAGVALEARAVARRGPGAAAGELRLSRFALVPPLAFALQEHLESLFSGGGLLGVVLEPTFMVGVALQLPVALAAYLLARLLLRLARRIGAEVAGRRRVPPLTAGAQRRLVGDSRLPRRSLRAGEHSGRGPPRGRSLASACF
jgi:hypothetical protein